MRSATLHERLEENSPVVHFADSPPQSNGNLPTILLQPPDDMSPSNFDGTHQMLMGTPVVVPGSPTPSYHSAMDPDESGGVDPNLIQPQPRSNGRDRRSSFSEGTGKRGRSPGRLNAGNSRSHNRPAPRSSSQTPAVEQPGFLSMLNVPVSSLRRSRSVDFNQRGARAAVQLGHGILPSTPISLLPNMPSGGLTSPFQPASPFQPGAMLVTSTPATDNVLAQPHQLEAQTLNILNHMPDVNRGLNIANLIHVDQSGGASGASPLPGGQQPLLLHHLQTPHPSLQTLVIAATSALNYGVPSPVDGPGHGYFPAIQTDSSSSQSGLQPLPTFSVHPPSPSMGMANSNGFAPANGQDVSVPEFHRSVNTAPMSPGHAHPLNSPLSPRPNSSYFSQVFGHHVGTPILGMPNNGVLSPMASPLSPGLSPPIDRIRHEYACAYILFFGEIRARLESIHGTSNPEDIKRFAMDSWRSSSPDMQQDYHRRAADLLQEIYKQQDEILRRRKGGQGQGQDPHGNGTPGIGPHEAIEPNGFPTGLSHHSPLLMTLNLSQPPRFANAHAQPQRMNGGHVGDVGMLLSDVILRGGSVQNGGSGWLDNMHPGADMMRHSTQPSVQRRHSHQGDDEDDFEPPSPSDSSGDPTFRGNDDYHSSTRTKASSKRKRASSPARHHGAGGHNGTAPDATVNGTVKRTRTKKRIKDPDAPKHPMSAFLHFLKAVRPAYTKQYRGARIGEISKMISEEWKKLPGEEKDKYNAISERDKQRYAQEMKVHVLKNSKAGATA